MGHPQNSPRGLFSKKRIQIPTAGGIFHDDYSTTTAVIDANSTGLVLPAGLAFGAGGRAINGNTTGYSFTTEAALPNTRTAGYNWTFITNSTGQSAVAIRTTAQTWKYLNVTSVLPT